MKGIILTNPFDNSRTQQRKIERMTQELTALGADIRQEKNYGQFAHIEDSEIACGLQADFVLYFDKDKYTAQLLEACGTRLFNRAQPTAVCDDKMQTHIALANNGIAMPDTVSGALCYLPDGKIDCEYLQYAENTLGLPIVVKECHGSYGEQVYLAKTHGELADIVEKIKRKEYLFQRYIGKSGGKDMRVVVVGGKALCAVTRTPQNGEFRSNAQLGGTVKKADIPFDIAKLCEKAARILKLDYCGIDILLADEPLLCEVNSNAMFYATEQATGVNVAGAYARHIIDCVKNNE